METFEELIEAVQDDLTLGDESSFMGLSVVKRAINRAYINKVSAIFRWPQTEDAKVTDARANIDYLDYPDRWRPNSIWKLKIDGVDYGDPLAFKDYETEVQNNYPRGFTKIWSNKALRYHFKPTPAGDGDGNIEIHGQKIPVKLVLNGDYTIFSMNMPELNEAIVLEAKAILKSKGEEEGSGQFASAEAKQICITAWGKLRQEQAKYERVLPQFNVGDMFGRSNSSSIIGNFERR